MKVNDVVAGVSANDIPRVKCRQTQYPLGRVPQRPVSCIRCHCRSALRQRKPPTGTFRPLGFYRKDLKRPPLTFNHRYFERLRKGRVQSEPYPPQAYREVKCPFGRGDSPFDCP